MPRAEKLVEKNFPEYRVPPSLSLSLSLSDYSARESNNINADLNPHKSAFVRRDLDFHPAFLPLCTSWNFLENSQGIK
jgi:hypothetical protein